MSQILDKSVPFLKLQCLYPESGGRGGNSTHFLDWLEG